MLSRIAGALGAVAAAESSERGGRNTPGASSADFPTTWPSRGRSACEGRWSARAATAPAPGLLVSLRHALPVMSTPAPRGSGFYLCARFGLCPSSATKRCQTSWQTNQPKAVANAHSAGVPAPRTNSSRNVQQVKSEPAAMIKNAATIRMVVFFPGERQTASDGCSLPPARCAGRGRSTQNSPPQRRTDRWPAGVWRHRALPSIPGFGNVEAQERE
jgi:hypothetical protein